MNTGRRAQRLGMKDRFLAFDHARGTELETEVYNLTSDETLELFATRMNERLRELDGIQVAEHEQAEQAQLEQLAAAVAAKQGAATGGSAADELAKLAALHQQGALTDEEFASMKAKVLSS